MVNRQNMTTHVHFIYCLNNLFTKIFCFHCYRVDQKLSGQGAGYNIDKAREIVEEIRLIQQDLQCGERERMELMQVSARCTRYSCTERQRFFSEEI